MTIEELEADLAERFEIVQGYPSALSQTGEPYTVVVSGGQYEDFRSDTKCPILCTSEDIAVRTLRDAIMLYAENKRGKLYWRVRPEVMKRDVPKDFSIKDRMLREILQIGPLYVGYSRLLISDRVPDKVREDGSVDVWFKDSAA
jgi:hypothetical protein